MKATLLDSDAEAASMLTFPLKCFNIGGTRSKLRQTAALHNLQYPHQDKSPCQASFARDYEDILSVADHNFLFTGPRLIIRPAPKISKKNTGPAGIRGDFLCVHLMCLWNEKGIQQEWKVRRRKGQSFRHAGTEGRAAGSRD